MAVAVKNSAETASGSVFDSLPVAVLAGIVYLVGSLAIVFKAIPELIPIEEGATETGEAHISFMKLTLRIVVMLAAASGLIYLGTRLAGTKPMRGLRPGIFVGLFFLLVVGLLASWIGSWVETRVFDDNWFGGSWNTGIIIVGIVAAALLILAGWLFLRPGMQNFLGTLDDQGWFNAISYKRNQGVKVRRGTILGILLLAGSGVYIMIERSSLILDSDWGISLPFSGNVDVKPETLGDYVNVRKAVAKSGEQLVIVADPGPLNGLLEKRHNLNDKITVVEGPDLLDLSPKGWTLVIDRFVLRAENSGFEKKYKKVESTGGSLFAVGQVATEDEIERARIDKDTPKPKLKDPAIASGKVVYRSMTLLPHTKYTLPLVIAALSLWLAWRIVNVPTFADFLIATEAELNKVSWTTRRRLIQDTIVVLVTVILTAVFLLAADAGWSAALKAIGVLKEAKTDTSKVQEPPW
jgi:preprotein translocase SecE subunit